MKQQSNKPTTTDDKPYNWRELPGYNPESFYKGLKKLREMKETNINLKTKTMKTKIKVKQMQSPRSGSAVANQFIIYTKKGIYFQSYNSVIAFQRAKDNKTFLDSYYWNYSRTTSKYRNEFLNEGTQETKTKIKDKEYILTNLN